MVGVFGGEHRSAPPLTSPWCVIVALHVVSLVLLAGGEQGSTPPSPMCSMSRMMCVISPMVYRGRGLHGVGPLGSSVVCMGRGAGLRTAVKLFSIMSVVFGCWLSLS